MLSVFMLSVVMLIVVMLIVVMLSVIYADCHYAECRKLAHYAECLYAECHGAVNTAPFPCGRGFVSLPWNRETVKKASLLAFFYYGIGS